MKLKQLCLILIIFVFSVIISSCNKESNNNKNILINTMSDVERSSIITSEVSSKQKYYDEITDVAEFISEIKIYDEELNSNYIVHITLPPDYNKNNLYPMFMMTDGIWRLSDHAELLPLMVNHEIEDIILVSIGYDYEIDAEDVQVRMREFVTDNTKFLEFITNNLSPYLSEIYSIDFSKSTLSGHSLGGLFTHYAAFTSDAYENQPFYYYLISSPSLWMSTVNRYNLAYEAEYFNKNEVLDKNIYVTTGGAEEKEILTYTKEFISRCDNYNITQIEYEIYPDLDHIGIFKPTLKNTLLKFYNK